MPKDKNCIPPFATHQVIAPSVTALSLKLVTEMDLLRLKSIARLHARGLPPDVSWDEEAFTRVLTNQRVKPDDVGMVFPKRLEDIFDFGKAPRSTRSYLPKARKKDRDDDEK